MGRGRQPTALDIDQIAQWLRDGRTQLQISEALGVHLSTIERRIARLGLETSRTGPRAGPGHQQWRGGRTFEKGYVMVFAPLHPQARSPNGRVGEHRLVMEAALGRYLQPQEVPDHIDDVPWHNWPDNLRLFATNADHLRASLSGRKQSSPRRLIPGAHRSNQRTGHCPNALETLALCPTEIHLKLAWHIESHRPTNLHTGLSRRELLRLGAWRDPFRAASKA